MRALLVFNSYELDRFEIEQIKADFFYCLFDQRNLFQEDRDSHFFIDNFDRGNGQDFLKSISKRNIKEAVIHSDEYTYDALREFLNMYGILTSHLIITKDKVYAA